MIMKFKKMIKKREIKVIRPEYVGQIVSEFNSLTRDAVGLPTGYRTFK